MQKLIDKLNSIAHNTYTPALGLCNIINIVCTLEGYDYHIASDAMHRVLQDWEHFSGSYNFPINHQTLKAYEAFNLGNLYVGEYGRRRRELAGLIAEELRKCKS